MPLLSYSAHTHLPVVILKNTTSLSIFGVLAVNCSIKCWPGFQNLKDCICLVNFLSIYSYARNSNMVICFSQAFNRGQLMFMKMNRGCIQDVVG